MSTYIIGDIHGCYNELKLLLKKSSFNHSKDNLWICGDIVSRGPDSLKVMQYLYELKNKVTIVLGNHDLNLLSIYSGIKKNNKKYCLDKILSFKNNSKLINWLRKQPILKIDHARKIIIVHAGISPQWNIHTAKIHALEIENCLSSDNYDLFLKSILNNNINFWTPELNQLDRLRYGVKAFTCMRYCYMNKELNMTCKESPDEINYTLKPWFYFQNSIPKGYSVFFGHWSTLKKHLVPRPFFSLDTGCCWKRSLTMFRWEDKKLFSQKYINI